MIYLLLSILTNAAIYLIFKWFGKWNIRLFEAIVANYITAFTIGCFNVPDLSSAIETARTLPTWTVGGLCLGVVFISIFYLMAITAQKVGVSVTTIASKMSMALAVILMVLIDPNEYLGWMKSLAIALALAGVVLASLKEGEEKFRWRFLFWPLLILVGSAVIDFGVAHFSSMAANENEKALYACLSFGTAAVVGLIGVIKHLFTKGYTIRPIDLLAGVGLGTVNYGSIYFLVMAYNSGIFPKSSLLPINNLAVVMLGALGAIVFFKEKLNKWNWLGLAFSVVSIVLIACAG